MSDRRSPSPIHKTSSDPFLLAAESDVFASMQLATSLDDWNLSQTVLATRIASSSGSTCETSSKRCERVKAGGHGGNRRRVVTTIGVRDTLCVVKSVTDDSVKTEQMIIESLQHGSLSVADEARAYEQLSSELGWTDDQIGQRVGKDRSTIRNLRNLLALPPDVLELIGEGDGCLPQRSARKLVKLARIAPQTVLNTAQHLLKVPSRVDALVQDAIQQHTFCIEHDWDLKWPMQSISATDESGSLEIRACHHCPAFLKIDKTRYCTNPRCYAAKTRLYIGQELRRVSQTTGIPIVDKDEKVTVLDITYHNKARVSMWLNTGPLPNHLRLTARPSKQLSSWWHHRDLLGTGEVLLVSTNPEMLNRYQKARKSVGTAGNAVIKQGTSLIENEELALVRKARTDVTWLVMNTARALAPKIGISGGALAFFAEFMDQHLSTPTNSWPEIQDFMAMHWKAQTIVKNTATASDLILRERILVKCLINALQSLTPYEMFDWPHALRQVEQLAAQFDLKLPDGWNRPPVHKTAANCWHCGRFTSLNRLTDRDKKDGWGVSQRGKDIVDVYCPDCGSKLTQ
ncbi:partial Chromosome-partitioning protein Spo0J, partial [Anaerolineae bacterium]